MKIGIIGAPGAGKSKLAKKLSYSLGQHVFDKAPKVIDGYVEKLEEQTGYAYGYFCTYVQNFQIIYQRWTLEQIAQHKGHDTITCGTIYETICYSGLLALDSSLHPEANEFMEARTAMTALAMMEVNMFDYDVLLYLPYDGETILAKGRSYDTVIDRKVPEILEGHFKQALTLDGTDRENVKRVTEVVRQIHEYQTSQAEESAVRGSGETDTEEPSGS